ncbi:MAG: LPS-assembly protein LptD [Chitinophagaceae bacterium]|nr:LPS-assembly protein LptD [Oligoflexus sp.]
MRALLAATGLLLLISLSSSTLTAQSTPSIPQAPATPEEVSAARSNTSPKFDTIGVEADKAARGLLGVPTAGPVEKEPAIPADIKFPQTGDVEDANSSALQLGPQASVLYDAKSIGLDKDGSHYTFTGDVVLLGAGYVITADEVQVAAVTKDLYAKGHVLIIHQNQVFSGDSIHLKWETSDFVIDNAMLVASDPTKIREVSQSILGLTPQELEYEAAKKSRLEKLEKDRNDLRESFRKSPATEPDAQTLDKYTRLLEQDHVTEKSLAPSLAQQDVDKRKRFERRRVFWEKGRAEASKSKVPATLYFRLRGQSLERKDGNTYIAKDAIFTPCICADDESPAWGFQADEIVAQQEGYINLKHPILTIKGIPIIYLPFLKLPMKAQRQSGFLMPSFQSGQPKNGFVYSQPVFFDFGPNADTTLTTDMFQKRGTRLGLDTRYEARSASGFQFQYESIRDRSFLETNSYRRDLSNYFTKAQTVCDPNTLAPADYRACVQGHRTYEDGLKNTLSPAENTWRGKEVWSGRYSLAPRLSFVTKGQVVSDHRYLEDLYLPEEIVTAFAPKSYANAFSTSKAKVNFDGKDFFLGLKSSYGDNSLQTKQYTGLQEPVSLDFQSRYFRIFPASWWKTPTYGEIRVSSIRIEDHGTADLATDTILPPNSTLGSGNWNRAAINFVTPLSTEGIVKVDHFAEAEVRYVNHNDLDVKTSTIRSWKTGINLNLPVDGLGKLPGLFQPKNPDNGVRYGRHIMNWGLTFSERPVVVRDGPYGDLKDAKGAPVVYFPSDRNKLFIDDQDVADEDIMVAHRRITLSTSHRWRFFDRVDLALPPATKKVDVYEKEVDNLQEQAKRDLMSVKDLAVRSIDEMVRRNENGRTDWLIRRYQNTDQNSLEPVHLSSQITYDGAQEKLRKKQISDNTSLEESAKGANPDQVTTLRNQEVSYYNLPEAWIGPTSSLGLNFKGFSLDTSAFYDIYKRTSTSVSFALGLPTFYSTQFGLRYVIEKTPVVDLTTQDLNFARTKTATVGLASGIIPHVTIGANLIRRQVEGQALQYATSYQVGYDDKSGCWGLRFIREKDLNQLEEDANYILQLAVIFLGNRRGADISPGLEREIRGNNAVDRQRQ